MVAAERSIEGARLRIAVHYDLPPGGAMRALHGHVHALIRRGHEIELWRPTDLDRSFLPVGDEVPEHLVPVQRRAPPWWSGSRMGQLRSPRPTMNRVIAAARACAKEMDAGGFDVHLLATCPAFGAPPIGRYLKGPSVLYLQEPHRWLYEANPDLPWLAAPVGGSARDRMSRPVRALLESVRIHRRSQRARFEVDNARAFDWLLVNSLFSREVVLRVYGRDAAVCYLGVDTDRFQSSGASREHMVAGVGQLVRQKNAHLLVAAVGRIAPPRPRVEWVAGSGDDGYADELHNAAAQAGIELVIHPAAGDDKLVDVLSRARALVYTPRLEPFGLVPLEANACGLPVVGVAEGGIRETVSDGVNGLLVRSEPDDIAAAIERLLSDPALAERLGREGRRIVEQQWTLDAAAGRLEAELAGAVERAGTARGDQPAGRSI